MATEIERKFLLRDERWRHHADDGCRICQGYLNVPQRASVRVRIQDKLATLNIKSATLGVYRQEYEYPIPLDDARHMLQHLCLGPHIDKTRYHVSFGQQVWEVDVFHGANAGLVVAEIELEREDQALSVPPWLGAEVSDDPRYYNTSLLQHPYRDWPDTPGKSRP